MRHPTLSRWGSALVIGAVLVAGTQGCAALGITLIGAGLGTAAGQGTAYSLDSIAYKTFTAPVEGLETAVVKSLERMAITVDSRETVESGRKLTATAGDRDIEIELDRLTARTSRMRVVAKQGWFFRDRATANEIIAQTAQTLDDEPRLTQAPPAAKLRREAAK